MFYRIFSINKLKMLTGVCAVFFSLGQTVLAEEFTVNIMEARYYNEKQLAKLEQATLLIEAILNGEEFKQRVLNHQYLGKSQFANNQGLTNEQIYEALMAGAESYEPTPDHQMDLSLSMYYSRKRVVGYTYAGSSRVYTNSRYHNYFKPHSVAGNLVHEWTHKLGFGHDYKSTARRKYSVPYAIGNIVVEIGERLSNEGISNPALAQN